VIALAGIVCNRAIRIAGDRFNADIVDYLRQQHNVSVGERGAELIKFNVGSALDYLENPPEDYVVYGRELVSGLPKKIVVTYKEIAKVIDSSIRKSEDALLSALEITHLNFVRTSTETVCIWLAGARCYEDWTGGYRRGRNSPCILPKILCVWLHVVSALR